MTAHSDRHELAELRRMLQIAPFHRWLGLEVVDLNDRELILEMPWREEIISNPMVSSAHGGVLSALIDLTGLYTINALGGTARATANLNVDFHRPATPGSLLSIGRVVKLGKQLSVAETRIEDSDGRLLASGRAAYVA